MFESLSSKEIEIMIISSLVSVLLGGFLSILLKSLLSAKKYYNTGIDYIISEWYIYNISFIDGVEIINKGKWKIKKSLFRGVRINIEYYDENNNVVENLYYSGNVYREAGNIIVSIKGEKHSETVFCRLIMPNPSRIKFIYGIYLGTNLDYINTAASLLLTKDEIDTSFVKEKYAKKFKATGYSLRLFQ